MYAGNSRYGGLTMTNFKGNVAVVTGSGRGFGAATVKRFAELGADVAINDIVFYDETDRLVTEIENLGRRGLRIKADVTNRDEVRQMFKTVYDTFGRIDILVNNAGVSRMKDFEVMSDEDWDFVVDTNLKSMFITTQEVFPYFKMNERSRIVNLASMSGQLAGPVINYGVSKADVVEGIMFLASFDHDYITAHTLNINGGTL
jgi:NAD(P)-dependent dehydrogenase (short-subunit alcohol dehydrogenase family)